MHASTSSALTPTHANLTSSTMVLKPVHPRSPNRSVQDPKLAALQPLNVRKVLGPEGAAVWIMRRCRSLQKIRFKHDSIPHVKMIGSFIYK